jgi:hypothetical protein
VRPGVRLGWSRKRGFELLCDVEHVPNLPNFLHPIQVVEETRLEPDNVLSLLDLLDVIEQELGR